MLRAQRLLDLVLHSAQGRRVRRRAVALDLRGAPARGAAAVDEGKLKAGQDVTTANLVEAGILRRPKDGLRLLGSGELKAKLGLTVDHATASAKAAVEKAGGSIKLIEKKVLEADVAKAKKSAAKKAAKGGGGKKTGAATAE